ncbi:MAG TPA: PHB depolymerase family esterase [Chitinophagaceae bacterium]|nr:PHB depolymerase family esterase [Chitinophagaceae bacterium]
MRTILFLFGILLFQSSQAQVIDDSLQIEGIYRSFHFNQPAKPLKNASLIFILHGSGGTGSGAMQRTQKLEALSATENFLVVYPDGYKHYWNECRKYSTAQANKIDINENAFFTAMIEHFVKDFGIDPKKIFAGGFSGGGHMVYKLALTMPAAVRAFTAVVANMPDSASLDCGEARRPIPIMIINGTEDATNPYNGGEMFVDNSSFGVVRSTEKTFAYWATLAGYTGAPQKKQLPDTDPSDKKTIESYSYTQKGKPEVTLLKVVGGHHDYPNDIDVWVEAWKFFKRQL